MSELTEPQLRALLSVEAGRVWEGRYSMWIFGAQKTFLVSLLRMGLVERGEDYTFYVSDRGREVLADA